MKVLCMFYFIAPFYPTCRIPYRPWQRYRKLPPRLPGGFGHLVMYGLVHLVHCHQLDQAGDEKALSIVSHEYQSNLIVLIGIYREPFCFKEEASISATFSPYRASPISREIVATKRTRLPARTAILPDRPSQSMALRT